MIRTLAACLIGVAAGLIVALPAMADPSRGAQLAATCAACHRLDGHGTPSIIGRSAEQLVDTLKGFKDDAARNHVMKAVSRSLSDDEIEIVAHYLSTIGKQAERP